MDSKDEANKREDEIIDIIREIVKKSSGGEYIYRGQSGTYYSQSGDDDVSSQPDDDDTFPQVTSTLYRALYRELEKRRPKGSGDEFREWCEWFDMEHDMNLVQEEALDAARKFVSEDCSDKEILSSIQHYSGHTNLIDFTKDYLVALFFASYHKYGEKDGEDGKVFLLETAKLKGREIKTINSAHPHNRVTAQKSVFVQSRSGIIPIKNLMEVVKIPRNLKQPILDYLKEHHDISLSTIYNDLHGYVRNSKEHGDAIMEFYLGVNYNNKSDKAQLPKDKSDAAEKAMRHFDKAISLDPKYVRAYNARGIAKHYCGDVKQDLGHVSGAKSDYEGAISDYNKVVALDPKYAKAYSNRGLVKQSLGNVLDAIRDYDEAIALAPDAAMTYNNRGNAKMDCGDIKKKSGDALGAISDYGNAISDYDKAIVLAPDMAMVYNNRGTAKRYYGDTKLKLGKVLVVISGYKDAISDYDKAIVLAPNDAMAYNNRGNAKLDCEDAKRKLSGESGTINDYKDAINDYDKAIALDPKHVTAYNNRGNAKVNCGNTKKESDGSGAISDYKDAISDYDKSIALDSKYVTAYNNRGNAKMNCGDIKKDSGDGSGAISDYKDAISDYDKSIALDPDDADLYNNRGNAKLKLDDVPGAINDYDKSIALNPDYVEAYFNRGIAKEELGGRKNLQQALSDFEKAKELAPQKNRQDVVDKTQRGIERVTAKIDKLGKS